MTCESCGSERFSVVHVFRNKMWHPARKQWVFTPEIDSREVLCADCQKVYITETSIRYKSIYDEKLMRIKFVNPKDKNNE